MRSLKGAFMTQLLIRLFIRRPNSPQDPHVRAAYGNLASVVGMVCNILLCLGKFVVGTLFGSIAITADALNNLSDASSSSVWWVSSWLPRHRMPSIPMVTPASSIWRGWW